MLHNALPPVCEARHLTLSLASIGSSHSRNPRVPSGPPRRTGSMDLSDDAAGDSVQRSRHHSIGKLGHSGITGKGGATVRRAVTSRRRRSGAAAEQQQHSAASEKPRSWWVRLWGRVACGVRRAYRGLPRGLDAPLPGGNPLDPSLASTSSSLFSFLLPTAAAPSLFSADFFNSILPTGESADCAQSICPEKLSSHFVSRASDAFWGVARLMGKTHLRSCHPDGRLMADAYDAAETAGQGVWTYNTRLYASTYAAARLPGECVRLAPVADSVTFLSRAPPPWLWTFLSPWRLLVVTDRVLCARHLAGNSFQWRNLLPLDADVCVLSVVTLLANLLLVYYSISPTRDHARPCPTIVPLLTRGVLSTASEQMCLAPGCPNAAPLSLTP